MTTRLHNLTLALTLGLASATALAQNQDIDSAETLAEQNKARLAEANPATEALSVQVLGGGGSGPLVAGVDDVTIGAFRIDVLTDMSTVAFTGAELWGAAYDAGNDRLLFNDGATLMEWPVGGAVNTLGTITDPGMTALSMTGLAFGNGTLYACRNIANEAIYEVNLTTLVATVFIDYDDASFDCGGLAFNPDDGMLYMTNDDTAPLGSGLYRMNMDGTGTLITPYPAGQTDIDGLAIGGGRAYLVIDEPGNLFVWDFGLAAYQTPLTSPFATSEVFSSGAWIAPAGGGGLFINEVVYNTPGTDGPNEYLEFRGAPSAVIPAGTYLVEIEGDGAGAGTVDRVFDLSGRTLGTNGYMVFLQQNNTYTVDPQATTATATGAGWTGLGGANDMENGTVSFLLISAPAAPVIGVDVDGDNDGTLDGVATTWTIVDSVAGTDGGGADINYGALPCGALAFTPGLLDRIGESTGSTATDWVCAGVAGTAPNFTLDNTNVAPMSLAGRALDHIGSFNFPPLIIEADLGVTKTAPANAVPGTTIAFQMVASNAGPEPVTGATLTDNFPASVSMCTWTCTAAGGAACPASGMGNINAMIDLPVGGTATFNASCQIAAGATGTLSNTATIASPITDPNATNDSATSNTNLTPQANLGVTKTDGVATTTPGTSTTYTIVASNAGPSDAPGSTVTDSFPAACTSVTWSCVGAGGGTCTANGSGNIADVVNLPLGASVTYTAICMIDAAATGTLDNTVTVATAGGVTDPTAANDSATDSDTLVASSDVSISKVDQGVPVPTLIGSNFSYLLTASNAGPSDATGVVVTDSLPSTLTYVSNSCGATFVAPTLTWNVGTLAPTASASCTINVTVATLGGIVNTATISSASADPAGGNNSATNTLTGAQAVDVAISLTSDAGALAVGDSYTYTVTGSNLGVGLAGGLDFTLELSSKVSFVSSSCGAVLAGNTLSWSVATLADGASTSCNITVVVVLAGDIQATASVVTATFDPDLSNNTADLVVGTGAIPVPALGRFGLLLLALLGLGIGLVTLRRS